MCFDESNKFYFSKMSRLKFRTWAIFFPLGNVNIDTSSKGETIIFCRINGVFYVPEKFRIHTRHHCPWIYSIIILYWHWRCLAASFVYICPKWLRKWAVQATQQIITFLCVSFIFDSKAFSRSRQTKRIRICLMCCLN